MKETTTGIKTKILLLLQSYKLKAVLALQQTVKEVKDKFSIEMHVLNGWEKWALAAGIVALIVFWSVVIVTVVQPDQGEPKKAVKVQAVGQPPPVPVPVQRPKPKISKEEITLLAGQISEAMRAKDWPTAKIYALKLREIEPTRPGLNEDFQKIENEIAEQMRLKLLRNGIEKGERVFSGKNACDSGAVINIWETIRTVKKTDTEYKKVSRLVQRLESCRKRMVRDAIQSVRNTSIAKRDAYAKRLEEEALDDGRDYRITLSGKFHEKIRIVWILFNRVEVHQLVNDNSFMNPIYQLGFRKITFADGWYESFSADLSTNTESDETKALRHLTKSDFDKPLKL